MRSLFVLVVALSSVASLVPLAQASDPFPRPATLCADPSEIGSGCTSPYDYEDYLFLDGLAALPNDYRGGNVWKYSSARSGFPEIDNDPRELFGVTGMSIDKAWLRSTGRPDVVVAVLDSGIRWQDADLRLKAFLNRGELPVPLASTNTLDAYDSDFNGVLDVDDYAAEVSDLNANGHLDAGDLIREFSDGVDDDANGFVDDVSGWNFLDDTNDPFDEVDYGHGTGEAKDSAAEANNGGGFPGVCPSCRFVPLRVGQSFIAHSEDYAQAVLYAVDIGANVVQEALGTVDMVQLANDAHRYAWDHGVPLIASAADEAAYHHNFPSGGDFTINVNSIRTPSAPLQQYPRSFLYLNGCTNFGGNVWASVSSTSCSSEATGRSAGIAALLVSHAKNLEARGLLAAHPDASQFPGASPLSAGEIRQLFRMGADDIDLSTKREVVGAPPTVQYASQPGWDQYSGWGRLNADKMLGLLDAGKIPPSVAFTVPGWWASVDALQTEFAEMTVEVSTRPLDFLWVDFSVGCGVQPLAWFDVSYTFVDAAEPDIGPISGPVSATYSPTGVAALCGITPRPPVGANDFTVTLRAQAVTPDGLVGEDRRTIQITMDPTLLAGWPRQLDGSMESSADLVDLDSDGVVEMVVPTASGTLNAFRADGSQLPGFPIRTAPLAVHAGQAAFGTLDAADYHDSFSQGATAIGDVDYNPLLDVIPDLEIVATSLNGNVYAWDHLGEPLPGFPVSINPAYSDPSWRDRFNSVIRGFEAAPTLADLDGDGDLEIIAAAMDRHVYAWHHDATPVAGFPVHLADPAKVTVDPVTHKVTPLDPANTYRGAQIVSTTAVGDLDGDGDLEIVVGANEHYKEPLAVTAASVMSSLAGLTGLLDTGNGRLFALNADGSYVANFPIKVPDLAAELLPYVGEGITGSPALGDLDLDGKDEIVVFATAGPVMVYRGDGSPFYGNGPDGKPIPLSMELVGPASGAVDVPILPAVGSASIGRLVPGSPTIVAPAAGLGRALDVALPGEQLISQDYTAAWDARTGLPLPAWPRSIEDLQFITTPAIVNVDADPLPEVVEGSGGYLLHAWDATGAEAPGFPKATNHWLIGTAAVGDLDGDGLREVVEGSREGWLWAWTTTAPDTRLFDEWWSDHHDEANTGRWLNVINVAPANDDGATLLAGGALGLVGLMLVRRRK